MTRLIFAVFIALLLALSAYPSTMVTYTLSTDSGTRGETACSSTGSSPNTDSCSSSSGYDTSVAIVTITDKTLRIAVDASHVAIANAFASITHDDLYSVQVNGQVFALVSLSCLNTGGITSAVGHFSFSTTNVSPTVPYPQSSRPLMTCGIQYQSADLQPVFLVGLTATDNLVRLQTYIDGEATSVDTQGAITVQLSVLGFQDMRGNAIAAEIVQTPESGTLDMILLALLGGVGVIRIRGQHLACLAEIPPNVLKRP